jgi:hypothetical protein
LAVKKTNETKTHKREVEEDYGKIGSEGLSHIDVRGSQWIET